MALGFYVSSKRSDFSSALTRTFLLRSALYTAMVRSRRNFLLIESRRRRSLAVSQLPLSFDDSPPRILRQLPILLLRVAYFCCCKHACIPFRKTDTSTALPVAMLLSVNLTRLCTVHIQEVPASKDVTLHQRLPLYSYT